ncbi:MAG: penicillin acylase family protein [Gemmatimonadetes bacterium]|nr:penicillin acylase family protein [Gemmatimonadota bacterium]
MRPLLPLGLLVAAACFGDSSGQRLASAERDAALKQPRTRQYDVRILRDSFGVPHIRGRHDDDAAYGLAWAHAEDDYATLEDVFLAVRGRSGAKAGKDGAASDFVLNWMHVRETVDAKAKSEIDSATWALLEGYAAGFNAYAAAHRSEVGDVARELLPMTPQDIVAGFVLRSPFFFGLDQVISALTNDTPLPGDVIEERGSNGFAVAPSRSADGKTRLIANSHQPWNGSVAWYELTVHSDDGWDYAGALFPGSPVPLLGHNKTIGWTNTVNKPDLVDLYRLRMNPANDAQYWYDGQWRTLQQEKVWLKVKMGPAVVPVSRMAERSIYGPVIRTRDGVIAVRYAGIGLVRQVSAYYQLNRATNWAEFRAALAMQQIPATNFIYADAQGTIALVYNGLFPRRAAGYDWQGVVRGDTSATLWGAYVPFDSIPQVVKPRAGYVYNSNNTPLRATARAEDLRGAQVDPLLGIEHRMTNRAVRAFELLDTMKVISREGLLAAKFDARYSRASWVGRVLDEVAKVDTSKAPNLAGAVRLLGAWDLVLGDDRPASALAFLLVQKLVGPRYRSLAMPAVVPALTESVDYLMKHHHRLEVPLGTLVRLKRGTVDLPLDAGPDVLRAIHGTLGDDGIVTGYAGDSFIMVVEWDKGGMVMSESLQPFGAAVTRPSSPHYADQAQRFVDKRFKPVLFTEAAQRAHLEREYRPGQGAALP